MDIQKDYWNQLAGVKRKHKTIQKVPEKRDYTTQFFSCSMWWNYEFLCCWGRKYLCLVQRWREVCWTFMWCLSHRLELAISDRLHEHLLSIKQYLRNLYYLYEKSTKKSLVYFIKLWKNIYDFQNRQLKLAKFYGTPWSRSSGAKHDWFCWQVGSLHPTYRKCHFWYSNALWHSHVRRVEKPNGWS